MAEKWPHMAIEFLESKLLSSPNAQDAFPSMGKSKLFDYFEVEMLIKCFF